MCEIARKVKFLHLRMPDSEARTSINRTVTQRM